MIGIPLLVTYYPLLAPRTKELKDVPLTSQSIIRLITLKNRQKDQNRHFQRDITKCQSWENPYFTPLRADNHSFNFPNILQHKSWNQKEPTQSSKLISLIVEDTGLQWITSFELVLMDFCFFQKGEKFPPSILIEIFPGKEVQPTDSHFFLILTANILFPFTTNSVMTWSSRHAQLLHYKA